MPVTPEQLGSRPEGAREWGPKAWDALRETLEETVPCPLCKHFGKEMLSAGQDYVNVKTGDPLYDPENFYGFIEKMEEAAAVADGRLGREEFLQHLAEEMNQEDIAHDPATCETCRFALQGHEPEAQRSSLFDDDAVLGLGLLVLIGVATWAASGVGPTG